jgi:flagellar protein FliS
MMMTQSISPPRPAMPATLARGLYRDVGVGSALAGASPHRLVAMLFDGVLESIAQARGALAAGDVQRKGNEIGRAVRIVEEGLKGALDGDAGGTLAADLGDLYSYVVLRLTQANLRNDDDALRECQTLIHTVAAAWASIAPKAGAL